GVARYDGSAWSPLGAGVNGRIGALIVFDDSRGGGPELYAAGKFDLAGGIPAANIARWNGAAWSAVGSGLPSAQPNDYTVLSLAVYDDGLGAGPALYAGGRFEAAGGATAPGLAKWDGAVWTPIG